MLTIYLFYLSDVICLMLQQGDAVGIHITEITTFQYIFLTERQAMSFSENQIELE